MSICCFVVAVASLLLFVRQASAAADHSPLIGWAFDGHPIYGPYTDGGELPNDLDACNGRTHSTKGYIYHVTPEAPYVIGCYRSAPLCETTKNTPGCIQTSAATASGGSNTAVASCSSMGMQTGTTPTLWQWTLVTANVPSTHLCTQACCNTTMAAYSWASTGSQLSLTSTTSCTETSSTVTISSNGIPNHAVGVFPMTSSSTGKGNGDNPNTISGITYNWKIPRVPQFKSTVPTAVTSDSTALPMGPIGFALNGVPFFNPYNVQNLDAVNPCSDGFEVMDYCGGHPQEQGGYHYHGIPWCIFTDTAKDTATERLAHKLSCYRNKVGTTCVDLIDSKGNLLSSGTTTTTGSGSGSTTTTGTGSGSTATTGVSDDSGGGSSDDSLAIGLGVGVPAGVILICVVAYFAHKQCSKKRISVHNSPHVQTQKA
eukprot:Nk52_evm29s243 gene=Nk52_evmTU29s243